MNDVNALFNSVFGGSATTSGTVQYDARHQQTTGGTMTPAKPAINAAPSNPLPLDNSDYSDNQAIYEMLRLVVANQELIKARLDGLTEAAAAHAAALADVVKAAAAHPAPVAAPAFAGGGGASVRPFGGGGVAAAAPVGGKRVTWGLLGLVEKTLPKKTGGTFTKVVAQFSNGYERDVPRQFIGYFSERQGQEVSFTEGKNAKGYNEIVAVG